MDLFTTNAAQSLHAQDAQRAFRELEYRRVAKERAAMAAIPGNPEAPVPVEPRRSRGLFPFWPMHSHRAAAQ